ncbi:MAG: aspartate aminotransferase [Elusimicrobia bacterium CG1_02_37_114]|nr:MAG: aspartate aminotransferase [Elusimicrobia bacterium CG1_02_37_114]PIV52411.1 MAG: aspartate aminotransferase [Elusimicrobia bacterium CG02_land_8_20_14_3_00_37_13]PIZ13131.1 MAG: aspartate aminotransferase [Elusimicrobia bacterium CG_4_10_14_0_8_um_filter_37_32]
MTLSKRISSISPSITLSITAKAKKMKAEGINVIGFGAGEPDFDTPEQIKESAKKSLDSGFTKYTPASGIPELKKAICDKFRKDNNLDYEPSQIVVSCGAKHSIYNVIQVLCDEDDEVIVPAPFWVSYPEQIKLAGARPVFINTREENGFKVKPEELSKIITSKTKLFILNSPSNPTGTVYSEEELELIAEVLVQKGIFCISDEIYEKIIYDGIKHISIASLNPKIYELTITVNGVSKSYSMTGWRIGYAGGPKEIMQAISNLQDHSTSNPTSFCQTASITALQGQQEIQKLMVTEFNKRRNYIVDRLNSIEGLHCFKPDGAFYVFPNVSKLFGKKYKDKIINNSITLAEVLLEEAKTAVIPGAGFGNDNYLRLSYATSMENIVEGLDRIEKFLAEITL